jgi:diguanylate cyclase (GGDEF)-like protein
MTARRCAALLVCAALLAAPASADDTAARTAAVQAVLDDLASRGGGDPAEALQRLRRVGPPPAGAPLALRRHYHAAVAFQALFVPDEAARRDALAALQAMATREGCEPCATDGVLAALDAAGLAQDIPRIRELQAELAARPAAVSVDDRYEIAYANAEALERLGDAAAALDAALNAARLATATGRPVAQLRSLKRLSSVNMLRRDFRAALGHLDEAMRHARALDRPYDIVTILVDQSYAHASLRDRPRQFAALREALSLARRLGAADVELTALNNLAHYYNGDPSTHAQARAHALAGERLARRLGDTVMVAFTRVNRGVAMVHLGEVEAGLALAREGVATVRAAGLPLETADLLEQLSIACEAAGRPGEAIAALREQLGLLEQIAQRQHDSAAQELQSRFEAERRALEIERLQVQQQRDAAAATTQGLQQRLWAVAALALTLAGVLTARGLVQVRRRSRRLQDANARLDVQARRDALTGAFNRRHAEQRLAQPQPEPLGLVLLDVDHFKQVNDRHGHAAGDAVLQAVAERLQAGLRGSDALVRWGGEEFLLLLPGCSNGLLPGPVERALARLGERPVTLPDGQPLRVTASAGAVCWSAASGEPWQAALQRADDALYAAKQAGRNRGLCVAGAADARLTVFGPSAAA